MPRESSEHLPVVSPLPADRDLLPVCPTQAQLVTRSPNSLTFCSRILLSLACTRTLHTIHYTPRTAHGTRQTQHTGHGTLPTAHHTLRLYSVDAYRLLTLCLFLFFFLSLSLSLSEPLCLYLTLSLSFHPSLPFCHPEYLSLSPYLLQILGNKMTAPNLAELSLSLLLFLLLKKLDVPV